MLDIPDSLRRNATGAWGQRGEQWLRLLPHLLDEVLDRWSLRVEQPFSMTFHWVAAVRRDDGTSAVLKLALPHADHQAVEATALRAWAGHGAVSLLAHDPARGALLLQRAQPGHSLRQLVPARDEEATAVIAQVMTTLHRAPVPHDGVPALARLRGTFERYLVAHPGDGPLPRRLVERSLALFDDLGADSAPVLLHGDLHHGNVLWDATAGRWLAIDPHGWVGDPGFDIGAMLYNPNPHLRSDALLALVPQRVEQLADVLAMPAARVAGWGLVMTLLSELWSIEDDGEVGGRPLDVALLLDEQLG